jgi:dTDP-4-dehydrorhamnose reductase
MILLLGSTGYVGNAFQSYLIQRGITFKTVSLSSVKESRRVVLDRVLEEIKPAFVINAAGFTGKPNVDACEHQKLECLEGNVILAGQVAEACAKHGVPWGLVSSGCIYNGARPDGSGFTEEDAPNFDFRHPPCSFYSGTKSLAEEVVSLYPDGYLWRLRIPFSETASPRNYLSKVMAYERLLDVRNSLCQLDEFVRACTQCWEKRLPYGIYNVTNPGAVTTREVVALIQKHGFGRDKRFQFFASEEEFMANAAKTPRASAVMDSSKILSQGIELTEVHEAIEWCLRHWKPA